MTSMISEFLPRMLAQSETELYRSKMSDLLTLLEGFNTLWRGQVLPKEEFSKVHRHCEVYLDNYLEK